MRIVAGSALKGVAGAVGPERSRKGVRNTGSAVGCQREAHGMVVLEVKTDVSLGAVTDGAVSIRTHYGGVKAVCHNTEGLLAVMAGKTGKGVGAKTGDGGAAYRGAAVCIEREGGAANGAVPQGSILNRCLNVVRCVAEFAG